MVMKTTLLDLLEQMNLPIQDSVSNLFENNNIKELKEHLNRLNISNPENFIKQLVHQTAINKLNNFEFKKTKQEFHIIELSKAEEKANLLIDYAYYETQIGTVLIASTQKGICYIAFDTSKKPALPFLEQTYSTATFISFKSHLHQNVIDFINGKTKEPITLHIKGTVFQLEVWKTLLEIPKGCLASYGAIAKKINKPKAYRAVGTAIGNNPISLLIPCHRVIQTNGKGGGYMWGLPTKFLLLGWEGA